MLITKSNNTWTSSFTGNKSTTVSLATPWKGIFFVNTSYKWRSTSSSSSIEATSNDKYKEFTSIMREDENQGEEYYLGTSSRNYGKLRLTFSMQEDKIIFTIINSAGAPLSEASGSFYRELTGIVF